MSSQQGSQRTNLIKVESTDWIQLGGVIVLCCIVMGLIFLLAWMVMNPPRHSSSHVAKKPASIPDTTSPSPMLYADLLDDDEDDVFSTTSLSPV